MKREKIPMGRGSNNERHGFSSAKTGKDLRQTGGRRSCACGLWIVDCGNSERERKRERAGARAVLGRTSSWAGMEKGSESGKEEQARASMKPRAEL